MFVWRGFIEYRQVTLTLLLILLPLVLGRVRKEGKRTFLSWLRQVWRPEQDLREHLYAQRGRSHLKFLRCPIEVHHLLRQYFEPHRQRGGITKDMIDDALLYDEQALNRHGMALIQVINDRIFVDASHTRPKEQHEMQRLQFILSRLMSFVQRRSQHCTCQEITRVGCRADFEFVLDLKDCQTCWTSMDQPAFRYPALTDEASSQRYASLPILTMTRCAGRQSIPVVQWFEGRDGPFESWDVRQGKFSIRVGQAPIWSKTRKAVFRGAFRPYSSFNLQGHPTPTRIDPSNLFNLGRGKLWALSRERPDLLDVEMQIPSEDLHLFLSSPSSIPHNLTDPLYKSMTFMTPLEQASLYRYVIYAEGWCGWADRLKYLLGYNSTILMQHSPCHEYYADFMKPYVHYVPIDGRFDNLTRQTEWLRRHERVAERIAANAMRLGKRLLSTHAMQCYMDVLFSSYSSLVTYQPVRRPLAEEWVVDNPKEYSDFKQQ